jgi:hypothetical protein
MCQAGAYGTGNPAPKSVKSGSACVKTLSNAHKGRSILMVKI